MKKLPTGRWLYVWLMPLLWLPCGLLSARYPGDKNLLFAFATFPGSWLPELLNRHVYRPWFICQIVGTLLVVVLLGVVMSLLRVSRKVCLYLICISLVLAAVLPLRSWYFGLDLILMLLCWVIYFAGTLSIIIELGRRGVRRLGRTSASTVLGTRCAASKPGEA